MLLMNALDVVKEINALELNNKPNFILAIGDLSVKLNNKCREEWVYVILEIIWNLIKHLS